MKGKIKTGQGNGLDSLKKKISLAKKKKEDIAKRVALLNKYFEKGEINYIEYRELSENLKELNRSYDEFISESKEKIQKGELGENRFVKNLPLVLVTLLVSFVFLVPLIQENGITGLVVTEEIESVNETVNETGLPPIPQTIPIRLLNVTMIETNMGPIGGETETLTATAEEPSFGTQDFSIMAQTVSSCGTTITQDATVTQNISQTGSGNCITFGADNIVLDCQGYILSGDGNGYGVHANGRTNITAKNCDVRTFSRGINFESVNQGLIDSNNLTSMSGFGILSITGNNTDITNNRVLSVTSNDGIFVQTTNNSEINNNFVNNTRIGIYVVTNANNNNVTNNEVRNVHTYDCITLDTADNNLIQGNTIYNCARGAIWVGSNSDGNRVELNSVNQNWKSYGLAVYGGAGTPVTNNIVQNNNVSYVYYYPTYLYYAYNNSIERNWFDYGWIYGILISTATGNNITNNTWTNTGAYTVTLANEAAFANRLEGTISPKVFLSDDANDGYIIFQEALDLTNGVTMSDVVSIDPNNLFVNVSARSGLNKSFEGKLNLNWADEKTLVQRDSDDDGNYETCFSPECNITLSNGNVLKWLASGWSSYKGANNTVPTQGQPVLNSSLGLNSTNENLTVYNVSTNDADGQAVENVIDWKLNGSSIAVLNMPFDVNHSTSVRDYSDYSNNGTFYGTMRAEFDMTLAVTFNSYVYEDMTSVTDYTVQSGDYLEYDVYWTSATDYIAVDLSFGDGSTLRDSGATDQNGLGTHPDTDISNYSQGRWYHRKISIPSGLIGNSVTNYDIACEFNGNANKTAYLDNIQITDGAGTVRKVIFDGSSFNYSTHLSQEGTVINLDNKGVDLKRRTVDGLEGAAFEFDGLNDYIDTGDYDVLGSLTASAWINVNQKDGYDAIISKLYDSRAWTLGFSSNNTRARIFISDDGTYEAKNDLSGNTTINTGQWYYISGVFNASAGTLKLYVNGQLDAVKTGTDTSIYNSSDQVCIGANCGSSTSGHYNGTIDEVRVYDRALSAEQILANYNSGAPNYNAVVSQETAVGDNWSACITPNDGLDDGVTACSNNLTILANNAPNTTQVILNATSDVNLSSDNLTCYAQGNDADSSGSLTAYYKWYKDGAEQTGLAGSTSLSQNVLTLVSTVDSSNTNGGENWTCSVKMNDGFDNETDWNNDSIIIAPACGDVITSDATLETNLSCAGNAIVINASNVTFNCAGHKMVGDNTGIGVRATDQSNIAVIDCSFFNFTQDIVWSNVNNSLINYVDVIINISDSDGDVINNSEVEALYITNSTNIQVINSTVANYSLDYVINFSTENLTYGLVKFLENVTETGVSMDSDVVVGNNRAFVNSSAKPGWNVSAEITLRGLLWRGVEIKVSTGGNYSECNATTTPSCTVLSYNNATGVAVFNVSSFTTYKTQSSYVLDYSNSGAISNVTDGSICLGDIDGDNDTDLYLNGQLAGGSLTSEIYLNNGTGFFTRNTTWDANIADVSRSGCAMGDLNLDRKLDLGICGQLANGSTILYIYNNTGSTYVFNQALNDTGADCAISFGDIFPGDGENDGFGSGEGGSNSFENNGGEFTQKSSSETELSDESASSISIFNDVDGDNLPDAIQAGINVAASSYGEITTNDGDGTFTVSQSLTGPGGDSSINVVDLNKDGRLDLIMSGKWSDIGESLDTRVYLGDGEGGFSRDSNYDKNLPSVSGAEMLAADWNADGFVDLMVYVDNEAQDYASLYTNNGATLSEDTTFYGGENIFENFGGVADFDGDGLLDLAVSGEIVDVYGSCDVIVNTCTEGDVGAFCNQNFECNTFKPYSTVYLSNDNGFVNDAPDVSGASCSVTYNDVTSYHTLSCSGVTDNNNAVMGMITDANVFDGDDVFTRSDFGTQGPNSGSAGIYGAGIYTPSVTGSFSNLLDVGDVALEGTAYFVDDSGFISDGYYFLESTAEITATPSLIDAGTIGGDDCYISSDNTQPASDPIACQYTGSWPTIYLDMLITANYNLTAHYSKNITTEFAAGTINNNYVGKVVNLTPIGNGTIAATGYKIANYNDTANPVTLVEDVDNVPRRYNFSVEHAKEIDALTPIGAYNNTLVFTVWV